MKKTLMSLGVAALMVAGLSSCGGGSSTTASSGDKAFGDSIANALGQFAGAQQNMQFTRMQESADSAMAAKLSKEDFLRGLKQVLDADTTSISYYQGVQMGLQLVNPIMGISNDAGFPVNKDKVYAAFKEIFLSDSVADMNAYYGTYSTLMEQVQTRMKQKADAAKAESSEAKENLARGEAYQKEQEANGFSKTESGLLYKVENPGTGDKVQPSDRVSIRYKGYKTDGTVFDETKGDNSYTSSASAFVPGFNEALYMLGKGGKMTAVIPANLAYGLDGAGALIGPNETLVFDIEVVDVNPSK